MAFGPRHFAPFVLLASLLAGGVACSGGGSASGPAAARPSAPPEALIGTKIATINGLPLGSHALDAIAATKAPADGKAFSAEERQQILDEAIRDELLFQDAFAKGLYHDPKVRKILVALYLRQQVYEGAKGEEIAEADLRAFYDQHKDEFVVAEQAQLLQITLQPNAQRTPEQTAELARATRARINNPLEDFRNVAIEVDDSPFKRRGGDVGFVTRTETKPGVPTEVIAKAFELSEGQVSDPFQVGDAWYIVYVGAKRERLDRTFEQVRASVMRRMKTDRYDADTSKLVAELRAKAQVQLDDAASSAWMPAAANRPAMPVPAMGAGPGIAAPPGVVAPSASGEAPAAPTPGAPAAPVEGDDNDEKRALREQDEAQ